MASKGWRTNKYCKVKKRKEFQATLFYVRRVLYLRTGMNGSWWYTLRCLLSMSALSKNEGTRCAVYCNWNLITCNPGHTRVPKTPNLLTELRYWAQNLEGHGHLNINNKGPLCSIYFPILLHTSSSKSKSTQTIGTEVGHKSSYCFETSHFWNQFL